MNLEEFKKVFDIAINNIIEIGIQKGYFRDEKRKELESTLNRYIENGFKEESEDLASFDPNTKTILFNYKKYSTRDEALIVVLHELKHALDFYGYGCKDEHDGFMNTKSQKGIGQNESCTERFAINVAEEILGKKIPLNEYEIIGLKLKSNLANYRIQDELDKLFCQMMEITLDEFMSMQNEENQEGIIQLKEKFNRFASFDKLQDSFDQIYKICYVGSTYIAEFQKAPDDSLAATVYKEKDENTGRGVIIDKKFSDYTEEQLIKIKKVHKFIQLAQREMRLYLSKAAPDRLVKLQDNFITTLPEFQITPEEEKKFDDRYVVKDKEAKDVSIVDMIAQMRKEIEKER